MEEFKSVWDALEDDKIDQESLKIKSQLMMEVGEYLKKIGITQTEAARKMGVSQPRVSDLVNGKIDRFTIDMLINMVTRLGLHVEVTLKAA